MKTLIIIIACILLCSCAMPSGYLPQHRRIETNYGRNISVRNVRDSSFSDESEYRTWSVVKVTNNSILPLHGTLVCEFKLPTLSQPDYVYNSINLEPFQWKEYYNSVPKTSRFRTKFSCKLEID